MPVEKLVASGMRVTLSKPDTDYSIEYRFEHHECWQLVREENASL